MLVLDENLPAAQQLWLRKWRIHFRVVGVDVATWGTPDENLLPTLRRLARPTFVSLDQHFYRAGWAHPAYALVWLDVADDRAAEFIRRLLRHPAFNTRAKRMGTVIRVNPGGLSYWCVGRSAQDSLPWPEI